MIEVKKLTVRYNNRIVGYLAKLNDHIAFQYDDEWINTGFSISPFSLPLSDKVYINEKDNFSGLYGVFADSLPDGWGELLVRRMLSSKGINPNKISPLTKLSIISNSGLGGLKYEPTQNNNNDILFNIEEYALEAAKILNEEKDVDLDKVYALGGSSGGARPKAHIDIDGEPWIIKFPCLIDPIDIGEKEFLANAVAKECGINLPEFKQFESKKCSGYFGCKRFDREKEKCIHMISLSSLLETTHRVPNLDYIHLFQVISAIGCPSVDMYEAFRRMCFNVIYENKDDHGKNLAFIYDDVNKTYRLSPAYDLTTTPNKFEHEMTVNGEGNPDEKDLLDVAKTIGLNLKECKSILGHIKEIIDKYKK